jgi:phosphoribosylpyrophosphate synthetase
MHFSITRIEFGSLLSYSPRGTSDSEKRSRTMMRYLKTDTVLRLPSRKSTTILTSSFISQRIKKNISILPFADFFKTNPVLIPIPRSSLTYSQGLWVPQRLANALIQHELGKDVVECLERVIPLNKAATSLAENRPKAAQHYVSLEVKEILSEPPKEILLVDDIITRGATIFGAANKLADVFPQARIRAFAAMRTISPPFVFQNTYDPCVGTIMIDNHNTFRRP